MAISEHQSNFWQAETDESLVTELSLALYERELKWLSEQQELSIQQLQKRIASLPYYIKRAAEHISRLSIPLEIDNQNGSWIANQSAKPFSIKADESKTNAFYIKHSQMALIVPVAINHYGLETVVLDTIDEVDDKQGRIHINQHGWFELSGRSLETSPATEKRLLKPSKASMSAACCGHQWLNCKKTTSRLLSLREMLLATRINWSSLGKLLTIKKGQRS